MGSDTIPTRQRNPKHSLARIMLSSNAIIVIIAMLTFVSHATPIILLSRIRVNKTKLLNTMCTLVAISMTLWSLKCSVFLDVFATWLYYTLTKQYSTVVIFLLLQVHKL